MKGTEKNIQKCISTENNDNNKDTGDFMKKLVAILKQLRGENGCPWDRAQTHESIKTCLIEEAYEVIEAINKKDMSSLKEELGDLLLQVVFHAQIAEENGQFCIDDVIQAISDKLVYRHPHVFSDVNANNVDEALTTWESMKKKEKEIKTQTEAMRKISSALPALMKSYKIQKKAADVGFDWDDVKCAFDKVNEETLELLEIYKGDNKEKIREEVGDLLFAVVNVARFLGVDPEDALHMTNAKFVNRFSYIENTALSQGRNLEEMNLDEMDVLWEEAKKKFRKSDKKEGFF